MSFHYLHLWISRMPYQSKFFYLYWAQSSQQMKCENEFVIDSSSLPTHFTIYKQSI